MTRSVTRAIKVLDAQYVNDAQSIIIVGECEEGRLRTQIHRNCFSYGSRTEGEIREELQKTASMMMGKTINMVFDEDLDGKIKDGARLAY